MGADMYVDVAKLLQGGLEVPTPDVLPFSDEFCLFYSGSLNLIFGDAESGKTWLCLAAVASVLGDGGRATIIDLDHNGASALIGNLMRLGVDEAILSNLNTFRLAEPSDRVDLLEVVRHQDGFGPDVIVLDSLGEVLPLFKANSNSADDFTTTHAQVIKPMTRTGASVLVVDHLAKSADSRSVGPTGTIAKMRATNGLALRVDAEKQFTPGVGGRAKLRLYKDRHGGVRRYYSGKGEIDLGAFDLIADGDALRFAFSSAQSVKRLNDDEQTLRDVAKLREVFDERPTVREARKALSISMDRARLAVKAFDDVASRSTAA